MQTDPAAYHSPIGPLAALLRRHGAAPTGLPGRPVRCRSVTMSGVVVPVPAGPRRPKRLTKRRPMVLMDICVGHWSSWRRQASGSGPMSGWMCCHG